MDASFAALESERLILRRFKEADIKPFASYRAHQEVERYQGWKDYTLENAEKFFKEMAGMHPGIPGTWFQFAMELKSSSSLIGDCALHVRADDVQQAEIGFTLSPEFQGQGYATEAVSCLLQYIFVSLGKRRVSAVTDTRNLPSIRVLERVGMDRETLCENVPFKGELCSEYVYAVLQDEWKRMKG